MRSGGWHEGHEWVQAFGCTVLYFLASANDENGLVSGNAERQVKIAEAGGIDAVISALRSSDNIAVMERGCWALRQLAENPQLKGVVKDKGGLEVALTMPMKKVLVAQELADLLK